MKKQSIFTSELGIFLSAFIVRLFYVIILLFFIGDSVFTAYSDSETYYILRANNLLEHGVISMSSSAPFIPDAFHTPLYPILLAGAFFIKLPFVVIVLFQLLAYAGIVLITKRIGELAFDTRVGYFAAWLLILEPMTIYWSGIILSDIVFMFFLYTALYLLITKRILWAGLFTGFAILTREIGLYLLAPAFLFFFIRHCFEHREGWRPILKRYAIAVILIIAMLTPWMYRNYQVFGVAQLSGIGWFDMYNYNLAAFCRSEHIVCPRVNVAIDDFDIRNTVLYQRATVETILNHPVSFTLFIAGEVFSAPTRNDYQYLVKYVISTKIHNPVIMRILKSLADTGTILWMCAYLVILWGIFRKNNIFYSLFVILVFFNLVMDGAFAYSRLVMPVYPLIFLLLGQAMVSLFRANKKFTPT